jgi:ELWxxDGT repeat protein
MVTRSPELGDSAPAPIGMVPRKDAATRHVSCWSDKVHFAIFEGTDSAGDRGLWVTDGTGGGTYELTNLVGAYAGGLFGGPTGFSPDFTTFDGRVLFSGLDPFGHIGLWVTDGTAAGTQELAGITNANTNGLFVDSFPAFTVLNNEVLFSGVDAAGHHGLWVTNGTTVGTHELTGISGAFPSEFWQRGEFRRVTFFNRSRRMHS